jgi:hypothetical protein
LLITVPGPIPAAALSGSKINDRVKVDISNDGTGSSTGRTTVVLYASPDGTYNSNEAQLGIVTRSLNIRAGVSKEVVVPVKTLPASLEGDYFFLASVIAPTQTVQGVSTTAIDISPAFIDLSDAVASIPAVGHLGGNISVSVDVTNNGNVIAKHPLDILFELSPNTDGSDPVQAANVAHPISLKPGTSQLLHLHVPVALGLPSGNQFIVAVIDPMDVFDDTDLANNVAVSVTPVSFR